MWNRIKKRNTEQNEEQKNRIECGIDYRVRYGTENRWENRIGCRLEYGIKHRIECEMENITVLRTECVL